MADSETPPDARLPRLHPDDPAPFYEAHVFVCTNRREAGHPRGSCAERGADALRDHLKSAAKAAGLRRVRINGSGCLDRCELGPCLVVYPEGVWYRTPTIEAVDQVLERHLIRGERVPELILPGRPPRDPA